MARSVGESTGGRDGLLTPDAHFTSTVASYTLGKAAGFGFMVDIARIWVFVGVVAWAGVLVLMLGALARATGVRRRA